MAKKKGTSTLGLKKLLRLEGYKVERAFIWERGMRMWVIVDGPRAEGFRGKGSPSLRLLVDGLGFTEGLVPKAGYVAGRFQWLRPNA